MVEYKVVFSKQAVKDSKLLKDCNLDKKAKLLIEVLKENPYKNPPVYEKLKGDLKEYYSRRINKQHRLLYLVDDDHKIVKVARMWIHYE